MSRRRDLGACFLTSACVFLLVGCAGDTQIDNTSHQHRESKPAAALLVIDDPHDPRTMHLYSDVTGWHEPTTGVPRIIRALQQTHGRLVVAFATAGSLASPLHPRSDAGGTGSARVRSSAQAAALPVRWHMGAKTTSSARISHTIEMGPDSDVLDTLLTNVMQQYDAIAWHSDPPGLRSVTTMVHAGSTVLGTPASLIEQRETGAVDFGLLLRGALSDKITELLLRVTDAAAGETSGAHPALTLMVFERGAEVQHAPSHVATIWLEPEPPAAPLAAAPEARTPTMQPRQPIDWAQVELAEVDDQRLSVLWELLRSKPGEVVRYGEINQALAAQLGSPPLTISQRANLRLKLVRQIMKQTGVRDAVVAEFSVGLILRTDA